MPLSIAEIGAEVAGIAARLAAEGNPNQRGEVVIATFLAGPACEVGGKQWVPAS